jgi:Iron-containing alcohol dehydrogenase
MGLGTSFTGTTHSGSMAEHMISHYIDMFAGDAHRGTSHGEQVGVATLTMSRLQNQILGKDQPPTLRPPEIPTAELRARFGAQADEMIEQSRRKALDAAKADALNQRLQRDWPEIAGQLRAVMLPYQKLRNAMEIAGCPQTGGALGLAPESTATRSAMPDSFETDSVCWMWQTTAASCQLSPKPAPDYDAVSVIPLMMRSTAFKSSWTRLCIASKMTRSSSPPRARGLWALRIRAPAGRDLHGSGAAASIRSLLYLSFDLLSI